MVTSWSSSTSAPGLRRPRMPVENSAVIDEEDEILAAELGKLGGKRRPVSTTARRSFAASSGQGP